MHFPKRVDLRFALLLSREMSHPHAVEKALRRYRCHHVVSEKGRCAGFSLGQSVTSENEIHWYVLTLQSDLAFCPVAAVRDYLRGWRKALFTCILNSAERQSVTTIYLPPAHEVYRASFQTWRPASGGMPQSWRNIYDRTARDFSMQLVGSVDAVNIQVLPWRTCLCNSFFRLSLESESHTFQESGGQ